MKCQYFNTPCNNKDCQKCDIYAKLCKLVPPDHRDPWITWPPYEIKNGMGNMEEFEDLLLKHMCEISDEIGEG